MLHIGDVFARAPRQGRIDCSQITMTTFMVDVAVAVSSVKVIVDVMFEAAC